MARTRRLVIDGPPAARPSSISRRQTTIGVLAIVALVLVFSVVLLLPSVSAASLPAIHRLTEIFSGSAPPAGGTLPITVLRASQEMTVTPPGATINIVTNFETHAHIPDNYSLELYLIDAKGEKVAEVDHKLDDNMTVLPVSRWSGPITLTRSFPVPKLPDGTYSIRVGLDGWAGMMQLTPGPGVVQDDRFRYSIGTLKVSASAPVPSLLPPATLDLTGYKLTFDDEFDKLSISDSTKFDGSRWYTHNEECCMQTTDGTGTAMARRASPNNPFLRGEHGGLDIRLQKKDYAWTSGVLTSVDNSGKGFSQQYGYFEMKAKFPPGEDTWPAFWLLNTAAKRTGAVAGEIDIVEYIANPGFPNYIATTLHDWSDKSTPAALHYRVPLPSDGFHTYGMMWTETTMTFYFDGAAMFRTPTPAVMKQPYYLLLDLGIGSGWPTEKTPPIDDMEIQYVRAYAR